MRWGSIVLELSKLSWYIGVRIKLLLMLQSSTPSVHKLPASVADTLKKTISKPEAKVDSLQKITERAEIGKDFFSDTNASILTSFASYTALQITIFSLLIGLAGFLSWRWIVDRLKTIETASLTHTDSEIKNLNDQFLSDNASLSEKVLSVNYDVKDPCIFTLFQAMIILLHFSGLYQPFVH